jgi:tetratricopeptide (TPR) repeat protein
MTDLAALTARARTLYDQRQYAELAALLAPVRDELVEGAPYAAFYLADAYRRLGKQPAALELTLRVAAGSRRSGIPRLELDRLNLEGMLHFETGDIMGAEASWRELLVRAATESNDEFVARANNNLGIIYTVQARAAEAVICYQRALSAYHALGSTRGLAQSHQNLAITYRALEKFDDADEHFTRAVHFAQQSSSEDEVARAEQERALLIYLARRDASLARATVQRAISRFNALNDPTSVSDSVRVLALIELGEGNVYEAVIYSEGALEQARKVGHALLEAELMEVLAAAARKSDDEERAAELEARASSAFEKLHAVGWGERVRALTSGL